MQLKFCENLKELRYAKNYTQTEMARMLAISRSTYANYEVGKRSPDINMLVKISQVLETSLDGLLGINTRPMTYVIRETKSPYQVLNAPARKKPLAIGVQEFRKIREKGGYYTDKTMMIAEFLQSYAEVTLITRPRRFGKTLNMSMLAEFLDCTKDSSTIFEGTAIMDTEFADELNRHPVIFISFMAVKGDEASMLLHNLFFTLSEEYRRYQRVWQNEKLSGMLRDSLQDIYEKLNVKEKRKTADCGFVIQAIQMLCCALEVYYGKSVYLLIDEYDTPFIEAHMNGYYSEVHSILAGILTSALKGNEFLDRAMLTGIQRVAKENIFSGLNNLLVCTVKDPEYSQFFGFTEPETKELLNYYDLELTPQVKAMYDGYLFDQTEVYNPWSVIFYAFRKRLEPYWVNTSENEVIREAMSQCGVGFRSQYEELIEEGYVFANVQIETSFYEYQSSESLWGLLINAGMVTIDEVIDEGIYRLRIPNQEVKKAFQSLTAYHLHLNEGRLRNMFFHLKRGDLDKFEIEYYRVLLELPSYHDLKNENSYHMLMLGMCAFLSADFEIQSNRESGRGRSDIIMKAKNSKNLNIIMEFKYTKDEKQDLEVLAKEAIKQVKDKMYHVGMEGRILYIGLAHFGKIGKIVWEWNP